MDLRFGAGFWSRAEALVRSPFVSPTTAWLLPASWPSPAVFATAPAVFANWPDFAGFVAVAPNFAAVGSVVAGFGIAIAGFGSDFASTDSADFVGFFGVCQIVR